MFVSKYFSWKLMVKPASLACGHSGCLKCLRSIVSLGDNASPSTAPCPICREKFLYAHLHININLDKLSKSVKMKCSSPDCEWKGTLEHARGHEKNCLKALVKCPHNGCNHVAVCAEIGGHCNNCEQQNITCRGCKKEIRKGGLTQHQAKECYYSKVDCPLGCGTNLPR